MRPIIVRSWRTYEDRIGVVWMVFGIPAFSKVFLPWEVPSPYPWSFPYEAVELDKKMAARS